MEIYYLMSDTAPPNKPLKILVRDENDRPLAEYTGYYDNERNVFTLYPKRNPLAKNNGKLHKHKISGNIVRKG